MSRTLKESLLGLGTGLASSVGLPRFLHSRLYRNHLSILMYHAVVREPLQVWDWCFLDESTFRTQIAYVKQHFRVVPLCEAIAMLTSGSLEGPTLAITFDDGYQNNYDIAFPILASYDCPATIFLTTKYIDSDLMPWFGRLNLALTHTTKQSLVWDETSVKLSTWAQKARASMALHKSLKRHHPYSIDNFVTEICRKLQVDTERKFSSGSPYHMLRTSAIRAMIKSGLINFGAHTHNHSILSQLSSGEQQNEIMTSLQLVERFTGDTCKFFAYPNGLAADYDRSSIELLKSSSVRAAVSTISGPNTIHTSLMELRRYGVGSDLNFSGFQSMVHHVTYRMQRLSS
jgi:peptidoglycan/xylan/chitin deacetylase (PgdA/CDA1 family)